MRYRSHSVIGMGGGLARSLRYLAISLFNKDLLNEILSLRERFNAVKEPNSGCKSIIAAMHGQSSIPAYVVPARNIWKSQRIKRSPMLAWARI